jgi:hypothetical protein
MANGLVKLVKTAVVAVSLVTMVSCSSSTEPNYSTTPEESPQQTSQYDPCQYGTFMECLSHGIYDAIRSPDLFYP